MGPLGGRLSDDEMRELLASILGLVRDACLLVDADDTILWASNAAIEMYRCDLEDLVGSSLAALTVPGSETCDSPEADQQRGSLCSTRHRRKDGSEFPVEINAAGFELGCGSVTVLTLRETSAWEAAELDGLFKSVLLDAVLDAILVHTPDGRLVYFNEAAYARMGLGREEFAALGPFGWVAPEARPRRRDLTETLHANGHARFESTSVHKDGSRTPVEVFARLVDSPDGPLIVSVARDISERVEAEEQLRHMALHDQLTGLANRTLLDEQLTTAMANTQRHGDLVGVAYVDLDDFKRVNDVHGHAFGDQVLMVAAERLRMCVRRADTVARLGGDEFVVLLPRLKRPADLERAARKIVNAMREPIYIEGHRVSLTTSVGLALYDPIRDDARSLLIRADLAMYAAKRQGANRFQLTEVLVA